MKTLLLGYLLGVLAWPLALVTLALMGRGEIYFYGHKIGSSPHAQVDAASDK